MMLLRFGLLLTHANAEFLVFVSEQMSQQTL